MNAHVSRSAVGAGLLCLSGVFHPLMAQVTPPTTFRGVVAIGATYIHQPAFTFVRGSAPPYTVQERETDGGGVTFGGAIEFERGRLWGGMSAQVVVPVFAEGTAQLFAAYIGASRRALAGTFRAALGPVLARADREERGFQFCLNDCTTQYPRPLVTGGVGITLVQEWRSTKAVAFGIEGQAASGAQRFASVRLRLSLGASRSSGKQVPNAGSRTAI
jgi:hypothetical protein